MECIVDRDELLAALALAQGVFIGKVTMPILSNVRIEAQVFSGLRIKATDLEIALDLPCKADVKEAGIFVLPGKKLFEYARSTEKKAQIKFKSTEAGAIMVSCGKSKIRMPATDPGGFPVIEEFGESVATFDPATIQAMVPKAVFCISNEESRYTMNAVLMEVTNKTTTMVATDGHRLSHVVADAAGCHQVIKDDLRLLVPKKCALSLQSLIEASPKDTPIEFSQDQGRLLFKVGERLLVGTKMTGQFPNYEAVLPKAATITAVLVRAELLNAVKRSALFSDERTGMVKLTLTKTELSITSSYAGTGDSEETIEANSNGSVAIGFNSEYLEEYLQSEDCAKITIKMKDDQSAGELGPFEPTAMRTRHVIMPMRT